MRLGHCSNSVNGKQNHSGSCEQLVPLSRS